VEKEGRSEKKREGSATAGCSGWLLSSEHKILATPEMK
jgi:hypothetical protein